MEVYLDNAATTRCSRRAIDLMEKVLLEDYGNPSSLHQMGMRAEQYIKEAKKKIAKTMKVEEKEIFFTSGGTESNNLAIIGTALANRRAGNHIITTAIEHASVAAPMEHLKELGFSVTYLKTDHNGMISRDELASAVCEETILASFIMINNEIGSVTPIAEAIEAIKEKNKNTLIHVDAIQAYGKYHIFPKRMGIDLLSASGHKIHAPKGIGFLYVKDKTKIKPLLYGGGQQRGLRSGTENVAGAAALGEAALECYENFDEKINHLYEIKEHFINGISKLDGAVVNGRSGREAAPHIVSVSLFGIRSEVMLHALEERGIYVSAGSACSSNKQSVSGTLRSIGLPQELLTSTIRFSFSADTTKEEIDYTLATVKQLLPFLRKFSRK
ncbi:MAG: cysteine desulfurase family protein [Clostridiales bacterium]|nr:cysteine desulfurase family protein [Clostridiales bacterium]